MELTPQTLHAVEFREARRGGYNTRDVDDFLERVAAGIANLHDRLREIASRAEAAEARLLDAQHQIDELQRRSPAPASSPIMAPAAPPPPSVNDADDTLRRTLVLAQRTADATIKEAKQEANRLLGEARDEAARTRAAAEDEARRGADHAARARQRPHRRPGRRLARRPGYPGGLAGGGAGDAALAADAVPPARRGPGAVAAVGVAHVARRRAAASAAPAGRRPQRRTAGAGRPRRRGRTAERVGPVGVRHRGPRGPRGPGDALAPARPLASASRW